MKKGGSRYISLSMTEDEENQNKSNIEKLYNELLDETLTPPEVKARLLESTTIEQKEKYVSIHKNKEKSHQWQPKDKQLIQLLRSSKYPDIEALLDLRIRLSTASKDYTQQFINNHGISTLLEIISNRNSRKVMDEFDAATIYEVLLSCKLVMNSSVGMKSFIDHANSIDTICRSLNFDYKPLALLVLEILSVSCFSEASTTKVVNGMKTMASLKGEAAFSNLTTAIVDSDVEIKAAVMEFINCIVVAADLETRSLLRSHLNNQKLDFHCEEALQQLDIELAAVEPAGDGRPTLRKGVSVKKVMNVDKLGSTKLVALAGLRANSMKSGDFEKIDKLSSQRNLKNKTLSMHSMTDDSKSFTARRANLLLPFVEVNCLGTKKVNALTSHHVLDEESIRRHAGGHGDTACIMTIPIGNIQDVRETTSDRDLLQLMSNAGNGRDIYPLEIVSESQIMTMGFLKKDERDDWYKTIQLFRDKRLISKSSYSMQRTYLELRDALKSAERFKRLYMDYRSLAMEEKQYSIDNCGIDINDINAVFNYLRLELVAQGIENKLLAILQEFLLIPSNHENVWTAIQYGVNHVITIAKNQKSQSEGKESDDESLSPSPDRTTVYSLTDAFQNNERTLPELLKAKAQEEGKSYDNFSKLALSVIEKDSEIQELRKKIEEIDKLQEFAPANLVHNAPGSAEKYRDRQLPEVPAPRVVSVQSSISEPVKEKLKDLFKKDPVRKEITEIGLTEEELKTVVGADFTLPAPVADQRYAKFIKMKEMLPEGAVCQKMKMEGFSEEEIDAFLSGKILPAKTEASNSSEQSAPAAGDPRYEKFEKMKKMLPEGAVRQKMSLEGFTPEEIDAFMSGKPLASSAPAAAAPTIDPKFEKFEKMKKMLPEGAVRQKMKLEGISDEEIEAFFAGKLPTAAAAPAAQPAVDPRYEKFEKMKKMLPEGAVRQKMSLEGFTPEEIDAFMAGKPLASSAPAAAAAPPADPRFEKFEKMKKMLPEGAVRQKMAMEGFTPQEIDNFFGAATGGGPANNSSAPPKSALRSPLNKDKSTKNVAFGGGLPGKAAATSAPTAAPAVPPRKPRYSVKMKNIYWNKLNENDIKNTLWKDIKQIELNEVMRKELEEWFAAKSLAGTASAVSAASKLSHGNLAASAAAKVDKKPKQVSLLDGKRTQNTLIALGKIRKTPEEISKMILEMDPAVLTLDITQSLLAIYPTLEEITAIKDYPQPETLDKASAFVYEIAKISNGLQRLHTQEIIFTWFTNGKHISTQLNALSLACDELKKSKSSIEQILALILSIGNYINDCTKFGDAVGIKINSLMQLANMKSNTDNSSNLLNFIALSLARDYPNLLQFTEQYMALWGASELSFTQIINDIANIEKQIVKLSEDCQRIKDGKDKSFPPPPVTTTTSTPATEPVNGDSFYYNPMYRRLQTFLNESKPKLGEIKQIFKTVEQSLEGIMNQFGESHKLISEDDNAKQFFTIITTFFKQLMKAHEENIKKEQAKQRKLKIEKEKAEREAKRLAKLKATASGNLSSETLLRIDSNLSDTSVNGPASTGSAMKTGGGVNSPTNQQASSEEPEENLFNNFFNRRSQSIEKTRNEFREKLQKSVRFSAGFKLDLDDAIQGTSLSPTAAPGGHHVTFHHSNSREREGHISTGKDHFRKSMTINEGEEDEDDDDN